MSKRSDRISEAMYGGGTFSRRRRRSGDQEAEEAVRKSRELNPHLVAPKEGATSDKSSHRGPPSKSGPAAGTDGGAGWLRRALKRAEEQAASEGRSLEAVAADRWGSLDKLMSMIAAAEKGSSGETSGGKGRRHSPSRGHSSRDERHGESSERRKERAFQSPHESHHHHHHHAESSREAAPASADSGQRVVKAKPLPAQLARRMAASGDGSAGWRLTKDFVTSTETSTAGHRAASTGSTSSESGDEAAEEEAPQLSPEELNKLNARLLKAELVGNNDLVKSIRAEIEAGKAPRGGKGKAREDVLMTRMNFKTGHLMPAKRGRVDEGSSLRDLIAEERRTTAEDQDLVFAEMSAKAAKQKLSEEFTVDDVIEGEHEKAKKKRKKRGVEEEERREERQQQRAAVEVETFVFGIIPTVRFWRKHKLFLEHKRHEQSERDCAFCLESRKNEKHLIVATGLKTYLCVPARQSLVDGHCLIVPMAHVACSTLLDEDVFEEMKVWRKGLVAMFRARDDDDCVFVESAFHVRDFGHMYVECVPLPRAVGDTAPIYFKKAILECDVEWAQNKKLVELSGRDVRRAIPKGFAYFAVDFGLESGYAHVIEDETKFPNYFGKEILGGMLELDDYNLWRKPRVETFDEQFLKAEALRKLWKPFDWTERVKSALNEEESVGTSGQSVAEDQ